MAQKVKAIETTRLIFEGIDESDAELIVNWRSEPDVYKYFKSPHRITLEEHLDWYYTKYLSNDNRFDWICIERNSRKRIGVFGLYRDEDQAEVNYLLAPEGQHKGYANEAIQALIRFTSKEWDSKHVVAEIHKDNKPSIAIVEKLGFSNFSQNEIFVVYRAEV